MTFRYDIREALPESRWDRCNDWLDGSGPFILGIILCALLAVAMPVWYERSAVSSATYGEAGGNETANDAAQGGEPASGFLR